MSNFLALIAFLFPLICHGRIQIPVTGTMVYPNYNFKFDILAGTPGQKLSVALQIFYSNRPDLYFPDIRKYKTFGFDPSKSSSFTKTGISTTPQGSKDGINGTDYIVINGTNYKPAKPFIVLDPIFDIFASDALLGYSRHTSKTCYFSDECTSFVDAILNDEKEKIMLLALDEFKLGSDAKGQLIFGDKAPDLCKKDQWAFLPEAVDPDDSDRQWSFNVNKIAVGKFSWLSYKARLNFAVLGSLTIPRNIYNSIMKALGSVVTDTVPCNTKTDIIFELASTKIIYKPVDYIDQDSMFNWNCNVRFLSTNYSQAIQFPLEYFSKKCIAFDRKNIQFGFTDRV